MRPWAELEQAVIDGLFRFSPELGRLCGDHRFDGVLADVSRPAIQARAHEIRGHLGELESAAGLSFDHDIDRRALQAQLRASLFELEELRTPFADPLYYAGGVSQLDVSAYIKRSYAPLSHRLASLRRHLSQYSGFLEAARANLTGPLPRPHLEIALQAVNGQVEYLHSEVSRAAREDPATLAAVGTAADQVAAFAAWLEEGKSRAHDDYALGSERFTAYLRTRELVDRSLEDLERMVQADLDRNTARCREVAALIAPSGAIRDALADIESRHPSASSIIEDVGGMLEGIRRFLIEHDLVSFPSDVRCQVRPTPSYYAYISAALDAAGALETVATESYYYVTVPGADWGPERTEEWLRYLNIAVLRNISIHEAYPGHYLQALHERQANSLTRRVLWVQSTGEGWAHYAEQMMVEQHFSEDPRHELAQLMDALLRDCRFLVSLQLHCHGLPMAEAVRLFKEKAFISELPATREALRGAWDPLYLNYTLGKLLILELRRSRQGRSGFSLKRFHDDFLRCGNLPVPLIAELVG
jgi:hypothetical protein